MIIYTALCRFTAGIEGKHKEFVKGEVYKTNETNPELDGYVRYNLVKREVVEDPKPVIKKTVNSKQIKTK